MSTGNVEEEIKQRNCVDNHAMSSVQNSEVILARQKQGLQDGVGTPVGEGSLLIRFMHASMIWPTV